MAKTDTVRQTDLQSSRRSGSTIVLGTTATVANNADTVDGFHAAAVPTAGRLLALDAALQFPASVIDWASVAGVGLQESPADKLAVKLDTNSGLAVSASGLKLSFGGGNPTAIEPDDAAGQGTQPYAARADHRHAIAAAAPTSNLSVTSANAEGNATSFARSNHSHAINTSSNPGANAAILASSAQGYLQLVRLGLGVAPSYPLQVQGTTPQLRLQQDVANYADFEVAGDGDLTIQPSGDSLLVPTGKTLASDNWVSQTTGWGIYPESTYGRDGYADFRYIYADELHVKAFVTDLEQALAGGQIISKSVAIIAEDFVVPVKGDGAVLTVEDLPGTTAYVFATGDWVRIRNISRSGGGLVVADAYGTVTQVSQNGDGTQTYAFWRAAADTGSAVAGTVVQKGGLVLDYGTDGDGYWEVTTLDPAGSPYAQVATWDTHPQSVTVHARLGNLDGIAGVAGEWGLWAGQDSTHYIKSTDSGLVIQGVSQNWIDSSGNLRGEVNPEAGAEGFLFWLGPSGGDPRFVVTGDGTVYIGSVPSQNVAGWAHASDLTKIDGGDIYAGSVTAQQMTVTTFNLVDNPGFEYGGSWSFTANAGRTGTYVRTGNWCAVAEGTGVGHYPATSSLIPVRAGATYYFEGWIYHNAGGSPYTTWWVHEYDASDAWLRGERCAWSSASGLWVKHSRMHTVGSNCAYIRVQWYLGADCTPGNWYRADDVVLREASGMNVLVGVPGGARVEINSAGIEGYSDLTTKQFYLRTSDGRGMFGGGKGVLDADGLALSGVETSYHTFNAIRWVTQTDPAPGGDEVARIAAGRWGPSQWDSLYLDANPGKEIRTSEIVSKASSRRSSGDGSNEIRAYVGLTATPSPQAAAIFGAMIDPGAGSAWVDCYAFGSDSYVRIRTSDAERVRVTRTNTSATPLVVLEEDMDTGLFHAGDDMLNLAAGGVEQMRWEWARAAYTGGAARRFLVAGLNATNDNSPKLGFWGYAGENICGPSIQKINETTYGRGRLAIFQHGGADYTSETEVMSLAYNGNAWFVADVSAASFTDRTPYPDKATALAAVRSLRQAEGKAGSLDHEALHEYVRARDESGNVGRNLSATVSAQNVVIQELLGRIELLEKDRRVS